jgi:transposase InsO family protein
VVDQVCQALGVSQRRACSVIGQPRSTQRRVPKIPDHEEQLTAAIIDLARQYGRYGYRRITALLRQVGWRVNKKRVERIWRREGLKVPQKQPKRGRLWLADGSCIRLRPERRNHVWSYDFVEDRTHDGRKFRMLNVIDEYTRQCLTIVVRRRFTAGHVVETLADLMTLHGVPEHIRSDQGRSSWPEPCRSGLERSGLRQPTSRKPALGRTGTARASTQNSGMSCWIARSSTLCARLRS